MKKLVAVYTPMNPTRPSYGRLKRLHEANVKQNDASLFDYYSEEVLLHPHLQEHGLWRGQNVIHHFNQFYQRVKDDYEFICKWDDDMIMLSAILTQCVNLIDIFAVIGVGLFQEDYGAPGILMEDPLKDGGEGGVLGWYGAFSRFYMYRMDAWGVIPVDTPWLRGSMPDSIEGKQSGDPDNAFQMSLKGNKHILDVPSIHLDHRAFPNQDEAYRVLLDIASFFSLR